MIEVTGDLWTYAADVRIITTNGTIKNDGTCVMGRGCALEAKHLYPGIDKILGDAIRKYGNVVNVVWVNPWIFSFPVKHHWHDQADLDLIRRSAEEAVVKIGVVSVGNVIVMPRPGCGSGNRRWEEVKPIVAPILDDRFHVITYDVWSR